MFGPAIVGRVLTQSRKALSKKFLKLSVRIAIFPVSCLEKFNTIDNICSYLVLFVTHVQVNISLTLGRLVGLRVREIGIEEFWFR